MKICPTCNKTYTDSELNYCLSDGATLIAKRNGAAPTSSLANEILFFVLFAVAVVCFLCLISYSPSDPTFNTASAQKVQNWIGFIGANVSEFLFSIVGITAYFLPVLLALIAWRFFRAATLRPSISRVIGYLLVVASISALASLIGWRGGLAGAFFATSATYFLSRVGAVILLLTMLVAGLLLITNLTFVWFFESFGLAFDNLKLRFREWNEKRSSERNLVKGQKTQTLTAELKNKPSTDSPTIVISGQTTPKLGRETRADIDAKDNPFITQQANIEDDVPPTISEGVSKRVVAEENRPLDIPIRPVRNTAELNRDDNIADADADLAADDEFIDEGEIAVKSPAKPKDYEKYSLPQIEFLTPPAPRIEQKENELRDIATELAAKTKEFNVAGKVVNICPGPVVTTYEFKPDPGVKYSRVTGLVDDLCLALKAESIRIDRIPGKAFVGIEVPNHQRETIQLSEVIASKKFESETSKLALALGKTIDGLNYVADLAKMPHLLIAGATGAGKSVGVNTLVVSILYKAKPDEVKFIMVDPKRLELGLYADIPHLATPIITDPKKAAVSLRWAVSEMERRYKYLAGWGVRNIDGYNVEARKRNAAGNFDENGDPHPKLPYIVIIIDELADLMMVSGKEVEESITRLAQMARAVGIHLVLATQRPSVDVITGLIKANFPARISFRVSSKVDSRTIIDGNGAESLLGKGDMLFLPPASSQVVRVHGAYVDEKEIAKIVEHIKAQGKPDYDTSITRAEEENETGGDLPGRNDPLFWDAVKSVVQNKRASTSLLQRHLRIGYGRAAAILDAMVNEGYIGEMDGSSRARPVLPKAFEDLQDLEEMNN